MKPLGLFSISLFLLAIIHVEASLRVDHIATLIHGKNAQTKNQGIVAQKRVPYYDMTEEAQEILKYLYSLRGLSMNKKANIKDMTTEQRKELARFMLSLKTLNGKKAVVLRRPTRRELQAMAQLLLQLKKMG